MSVGMTLTSSKTPSIIINEIQMMAAVFKGTHLLLEGGEDIRFWKRHISKTTVNIVNCEGKPKLLRATELLFESGLCNFVGVYDPDFERLRGISHFPHALVSTDENDLELTLIRSQALENVLGEFADDVLVADFERLERMTVVEHVERASRQFGELRLLNDLLSHRVNFDELSPNRFIADDTWKVDRAALHAEYASRAGVSLDTLPDLIGKHCLFNGDWRVSQGHDTLKILARGLRRRIGRHQLNERQLLSAIRLAYSAELLRDTNMYKSLRKLEQSLSTHLFDQ
jgi:Protein of unknown function (DUF4435)